MGAGDRAVQPPTADDTLLPSFLPLCRKLRDERGWNPNSETWENLTRLRHLRDAFIHFSPRVVDKSRLLWAAIHAGRRRSPTSFYEEPGDFIWCDDDSRESCHAELTAAMALNAPSEP